MRTAGAGRRATAAARVAGGLLALVGLVLAGLGAAGLVGMGPVLLTRGSAIALLAAGGLLLALGVLVLRRVPAAAPVALVLVAVSGVADLGAVLADRDRTGEDVARLVLVGVLVVLLALATVRSRRPGGPQHG